MTGTSSANPTKLTKYSTDGLAMIETLKAKAAALNDAATSLAQNTSPHMGRLGTTHTDLLDLVGDWFHLDEFAGDVAQGFLLAGGAGRRDRALADGVVLTFDDGQIARLGQVGYADRDVAIAEANAMADELYRLQQEGASPRDIQNFVAMAERGQYDPTFAVTFSERVGVTGYVWATTMIRNAYQEGGYRPDGSMAGRLVPPEGLAAVAVLGTMLTTALDTRAGIPPNDRIDPSNNSLPDDMRISDSFVDNLVSGWQDSYNHDAPYGDAAGDKPSEFDLSVLLRHTDPPTDVAVAIANNRMTPLMTYGDGSGLPPEAREAWGGTNSVVANYATMLGRNEDASAQWLQHGQNLDLTLQRHGDFDGDGGQALAHGVENGITHPNSDVRQPLMQQSIDIIGGTQDEIRNPHLNDAFANGVAANMDLIDRNINDGWQRDGNGYTPDSDPSLQNTHDFLREVMGDETAAETVHTAVVDYAHGRAEAAAGLPTDDPAISGEFDGGPRRDADNEVGRLLGTVSDAHADAFVDAYEEAVDDEDRAGRLVDYAASWVPYGGKVNDFAQAFFDASIGDLADNPPSKDDLERQLVDRAVDLQLSAENLGIDPVDADFIKAGAMDAKNAVDAAEHPPRR